MDTNMEDVGRVPLELAPVNIEPAGIPTLDGWIESLMSCKQLAEVDVQRLCEKVGVYFFSYPRPDINLPARRRPWPCRTVSPRSRRHLPSSRVLDRLPGAGSPHTVPPPRSRAWADLSYWFLGTRGPARRVQRTTCGVYALFAQAAADTARNPPS